MSARPQRRVTASAGRRKKGPPRAGHLPKGWKPVSDGYDDITDHRLWEGDIHLEKNNEVYATIAKNKADKEAARIERIGAYGYDPFEDGGKNNTTAGAGNLSLHSGGSGGAKSRVSSASSGRGDYLTRLYELKRERNAANVRSHKSTLKTAGGRIAIEVGSRRGLFSGQRRQSGLLTAQGQQQQSEKDSNQDSPSHHGSGIGDNKLPTPTSAKRPPTGRASASGTRRPSTALSFSSENLGNTQRSNNNSNLELTIGNSSSGFWANNSLSQNAATPTSTTFVMTDRDHIPEGPCAPVAVDGTSMADFGAMAATAGAAGTSLRYMKNVLENAHSTLDKAKRDTQDTKELTDQSFGSGAVSPGSAGSPGGVKTYRSVSSAGAARNKTLRLGAPNSGSIRPGTAAAVTSTRSGSGAAAARRKLPDLNSTSGSVFAPDPRLSTTPIGTLDSSRDETTNSNKTPTTSSVTGPDHSPSANLVSDRPAGQRSPTPVAASDASDVGTEDRLVTPKNATMRAGTAGSDRRLSRHEMAKQEILRATRPTTASASSGNFSIPQGSCGLFPAGRQGSAQGSRRASMAGSTRSVLRPLSRANSASLYSRQQQLTSSLSGPPRIGGAEERVTRSGSILKQPKGGGVGGGTFSRRFSSPLNDTLGESGSYGVASSTSGGASSQQPALAGGLGMTVLAFTHTIGADSDFDISDESPPVMVSETIDTDNLSSSGVSPKHATSAHRVHGGVVPLTLPGSATTSPSGGPGSGPSRGDESDDFYSELVLTPSVAGLTLTAHGIEQTGGVFLEAPLTTSNKHSKRRKLQFQTETGDVLDDATLARTLQTVGRKSGSDVGESDHEDDDDEQTYEELREMLHRHTKIGRTLAGASVVVVSEEDVAGLWPFEVEAAVKGDSLPRTEGDEEEDYDNDDGGGGAGGANKVKRPGSASNSRGLPTVASNSRLTFDLRNVDGHSDQSGQSGESGAQSQRSRRFSQDSLFADESQYQEEGSEPFYKSMVGPRQGSGLLKLVPGGGAKPVEGEEDSAAHVFKGTAVPDFKKILPSFNPRVRLIDGAAPGIANLGAANLRRKIYRLEKDAPVEYPRIKVEFVGTGGNHASGAKREKGFSSAVSDASSAAEQVPMERRRSLNIQDLIVQGDITAESLTFFPPQDLHLYQLFSKNTTTLFLFRPVSPALPSMYAGNSFVPLDFCDANGIPMMIDEIHPPLSMEEVAAITTQHRRVRGKGIQISLKSSPYAPIEGFIPVNPALSKTYSEAAKKNRQLEDQLIRAAERAGREKGNSLNVMKRMKAQQATFGSSTAVAMREIDEKLTESRRACSNVLDEYRTASMMSQDKLSVSHEYIDKLNEAQFLGTTIAAWRGMNLYFAQLPNEPDIERESRAAEPRFFARRGDTMRHYLRKSNELELEAEPFDPKYHFPVEILTHRSFVISDVSHRIDPDPKGDFIIGPDFDGLAYCKQLPTRISVEAYIRHVERAVDRRLNPSMGLVSQSDEQHVKDMRLLTEWKQNHGYENGNTVKTQELTDGAYVVVHPTKGVSLLTSFVDIIAYYAKAWRDGYPLTLNPNWRVVLSPHTSTPIPYSYGNEDIWVPIVDDCGLAMVKNRIANSTSLAPGQNFVEMKAEATKYLKDLQTFMIEYLSRDNRSTYHSDFSVVGELSHSVELKKDKSGSSLALKKTALPVEPLISTATSTKRRAGCTYSHALVSELACVLAKKELAEVFFTLRTAQLLPPHILRKAKQNTFLSGVQAETKISDEFEAYRFLKVMELALHFFRRMELFSFCFPGAEADKEFTEKLLEFVKPKQAQITTGLYDVKTVGTKEATNKGSGAKGAKKEEVWKDYLVAAVDTTNEHLGNKNFEGSGRLRMGLSK